MGILNLSIIMNRSTIDSPQGTPSGPQGSHHSQKKVLGVRRLMRRGAQKLKVAIVVERGRGGGGGVRDRELPFCRL